jgi:hypothetical protein
MDKSFDPQKHAQTPPPSRPTDTVPKDGLSIPVKGHDSLLLGKQDWDFATKNPQPSESYVLGGSIPQITISTKSIGGE